MTYLNLINKVLIRLRERQVTSSTQSTYSTMVGSFVNDAMDIMQDAWQWGDLRVTETVATVGGTAEYNVADVKDEGSILRVWNDTQNYQLKHASEQFFEKRKFTGSAEQGPPRYWRHVRTTAGTGSRIELWPTPDAVYDLDITTYQPQEELTSDGDVIRVPWRPVMLLAVAMLAEEKGETGETSANRRDIAARAAMADAIANDAARYPGAIDWVTE